jgi:hypothetical protein
LEGCEPPDGESAVVTVEELGGKRTAGRCETRLVVFPEFVHSSNDHPERMTPGPAALALMGSFCSPPRMKAAGIDSVINIATRVPCYRLKFTNLNGALGAIERLFDEHVGER